MNMIIGILGFILVAGVVWWCATKLIGAFGIPEPLATVIIVAIILIMLLAFLQIVGVFGGAGGFHFKVAFNLG